MKLARSVGCDEAARATARPSGAGSTLTLGFVFAGHTPLVLHQPQEFCVTDVASFGKSVDQLEGAFPVAFQNEPSAVSSLGYEQPMRIFGNPFIVEQYGNFLEIRKPRSVMRWTVKELFASLTGSEICCSIHIVQGMRSPKIFGAALPPSGHAESNVDGNHGHTE